MITDVAGHVDVGDPSIHGIGAETKLYLHTHEEAPDGTHDNIVTWCTNPKVPEAKEVIVSRLRERPAISEAQEGDARRRHEEL